MAQSGATSVLIVGDIKQSIYRWRGGDWKILHSQAQAQLDPASTEVEILRENYRSLPAVVEFNNEIIGRVVETDNRALNETLDEAAAKGGIDPAAAAALHDTLRDAYRGHAQTPAAGATGRATSRSRPSPSSRPSWSASARCWTRDSGRATS